MATIKVQVRKVSAKELGYTNVHTGEDGKEYIRVAVAKPRKIETPPQVMRVQVTEE